MLPRYYYIPKTECGTFYITFKSVCIVIFWPYLRGQDLVGYGGMDQGLYGRSRVWLVEVERGMLLTNPRMCGVRVCSCVDRV